MAVYNPFLGTNQGGGSTGFGSIPSSNTNGLDSQNLSSQFNPGQWGGNYNGVGGNLPGYQQTADQNTTSYNGAGGSWNSTNGGAWTSPTGQQVNDLSGYLGMQANRKSGSDFSGYQNQLNGLLQDPSKVQQTAGYQFDFNQGQQAIDRSAAARGMGNSGGVLAELAKYGQGMASKEYGNQVNMLSGLMNNSQNFGVASHYYDSPAAKSVPQNTTGQPMYFNPNSQSAW